MTFSQEWAMFGIMSMTGAHSKTGEKYQAFTILSELRRKVMRSKIYTNKIKTHIKSINKILS